MQPNNTWASIDKTKRMRSRFRSAIAIALTATLVSAVSGCSSNEDSQADSQAIESPVVDDLVQKLVSQASEMSPPQELDEGCTTRVFQSLTSEQLSTIRSSIESDLSKTSLDRRSHLSGHSKETSESEREHRNVCLKSLTLVGWKDQS